MRRREFIGLLGSAVTTWPLAAVAQQAAMPVVGYLSAATPNEGEPFAAAFRRGLQESGYVVGQNVKVEYMMPRKPAVRKKPTAPSVTRVAVLRDASQGFTINVFTAIQTVAPSLGMEVIPVKHA